MLVNWDERIFLALVSDDRPIRSYACDVQALLERSFNAAPDLGFGCGRTLGHESSIRAFRGPALPDSFRLVCYAAHLFLRAGWWRRPHPRRRRRFGCRPNRQSDPPFRVTVAEMVQTGKGRDDDIAAM